MWRIEVTLNFAMSPIDPEEDLSPADVVDERSPGEVEVEVDEDVVDEDVEEEEELFIPLCERVPVTSTLWPT
jgi:hypothetical protein